MTEETAHALRSLTDLAKRIADLERQNAELREENRLLYQRLTAQSGERED